MENNKQVPLLLTRDEDQTLVHQRLSNASVASSFTADENDIAPIIGVRGFYREFVVESKKLWYLAGPAIITSILQYSLNVVTLVFAGQVGTIEQAAVAVQDSVISGFCFGIMLGMGSALETLCGQAYGAGQQDMLGVYMQRSLVMLNFTALIFVFFYIFASEILKFVGQAPEISEAAGKFSQYMIPQLFAYACNFPMASFLQAQSKMMAMAVIAAVALVLHIVLSWFLMLKLGWGLVGAAVALNSSWIFIDVAQMLYILSGTCGPAWAGFSIKAFHNLWEFVKLSLASAVMICLEVWYFMVLILFAGYLKNAEVSVDALSICLNILSLEVMIAFGFNAAVSIRVANELGAAHPRTAKFSIVAAVIASTIIGLIFSMILVIYKNSYPTFFSNNQQVKDIVYTLTPILAFSIVANNVQPVLSGVAVGAGWQTLVAYVNIACYYLFGIPLGLILGFMFDMGVKGIWYGMVTGVVLQTCVITLLIYKTNWNKEASHAKDRIKKWGGQTESNGE